MQTWVAFLRGINVGGRNKVIMKELVQLMEDNGYHNVRTYIQSGNILYESKTEPSSEIGALIESKYGFKPQVLTLSQDSFFQAIENNPYSADEGKKIHFYFLQDNPDQIKYEVLESVKKDSESYELIDRVFYLYAPEGIGRSKLAAKIESAIQGTAITARNLNTILKMAEMLKN